MENSDIGSKLHIFSSAFSIDERSCPV